jgi:hypothetical protein
MLIYILTISLLFIFSILEFYFKLNIKLKNILIGVTFFIIVLQYAFRWETGTDWSSYLEHFTAVTNLNSFKNLDNLFEYLSAYVSVSEEQPIEDIDNSKAVTSQDTDKPEDDVRKILLKATSELEQIHEIKDADPKRLRRTHSDGPVEYSDGPVEYSDDPVELVDIDPKDKPPVCLLEYIHMDRDELNRLIDEAYKQLQPAL